MDERPDDPWSVAVSLTRGCAVALGALATLPVVASLILRQVHVTSAVLAAYVAGTPLVLFAGLAALFLFVVGGSRVGVAVAAVLTLTLALTQVPLYVGTGAAAAGSSPLRVMTINMHFGGADAAQLVAAVRAYDVDVLATQEMTRPATAALHAAGIDAVLPYGLTNESFGAMGHGLWSRLPLGAVARPDGFENPPIAATIELGGQTVVVATAHPVSPYPDDTPQWSAEMGRLRDWLGDVDGPAVVAGDLNATLDHVQLRDILATGYADAAAQVGVGWLPTYPANRRRLPLLVAIDHVLVGGGVVATAVQRQAIASTDHMALVVTVAVPPP